MLEERIFWNLKPKNGKMSLMFKKPQHSVKIRIAVVNFQLINFKLILYQNGSKQTYPELSSRLQ